MDVILQITTWTLFSISFKPIDKKTIDIKYHEYERTKLHNYLFFYLTYYTNARITLFETFFKIYFCLIYLISKTFLNPLSSLSLSQDEKFKVQPQLGVDKICCSGSNSAVVSWLPPHHTNGYITKYRVYVRWGVMDKQLL